MTKTFVTSPLANELKGSAWFRRPEEEETPQPKPTGSTNAPKDAQKRSTERGVHNDVSSNRTEGSPVPTVPQYKASERTDSSTVQRPNKDRTIRRAYDLYKTQLTGLHRIRANRELSRDERVSLSELVREAVDLLLAKEGIQ